MHRHAAELLISLSKISVYFLLCSQTEFLMSQMTVKQGEQRVQQSRTTSLFLSKDEDTVYYQYQVLLHLALKGS